MNVKVNITTDSGSDVDQVSRAVATRLKAYRKAKKMSLDELSRRASISKGMLVEMEKEACKLAAALGVSVADIVNVSSEPALHIIPAEQIPTLWQGPLGGSARLLAGTAGPNMIELWRWEMQPGEAFASPGHPATTFELLHVEAGALTLTLGETCRTVAAGESAVARTEIEHGYRNEGTAPLVFTMTVAELPS
ncbi:XRE family transcriptional regulator [Klebsiella pneumoniae]|nr:XRE family transcriptional regulator [Klebsiella pneumoniae]